LSNKEKVVGDVDKFLSYVISPLDHLSIQAIGDVKAV